MNDDVSEKQIVESLPLTREEIEAINGSQRSNWIK